MDGDAFGVIDTVVEDPCRRQTEEHRAILVAVGNGPVVSVLELHVLPGSEQAVARAYDELGIFERSRESGGFRGGTPARAVEPGRPMLVIAEWDDAESYQRWLSNPVREELGDHLEPMLSGDPTVVGIFHERALDELSRRDGHRRDVHRLRRRTTARTAAQSRPGRC